MKDRIEWTRMVSDCITGYRSAKGDADALPPRTFIRAWMNRNYGLQKIPGRLFRLFYRSDNEELNEAFKAGNQARKKESAADIVQSTEDDSPKGKLIMWANAIVKAVNEASAESNIWTADNFGDNIEIDDAPREHYYMHRIKVNSWGGCINDFDIDFKNGYAAGYIFLYIPVNPEDGYAFSIGGACDGFDVNESYNTYTTFEEAISGSIEEIIDCIEYWNDEVAERMSVYDDDDIDEAFRAGNQARKKESVVNTTNTVTLSPEQQIKLFMADVKKYRKWLIEQGKGKDFENKDEIWWPGEDFEAPVGIYFTQDNLFEIQDNGIICIDSAIDFRNYPYEIHLPDKLYCKEKIYFENCDGLIRLPEHLETDEYIIFDNCKNLRHLPDYLESGGVGVSIINCENLEEIPSEFQLSGDLEIKNCPKINSIPYNLRIYPCEYIEIDLNSPLRKFFDDRKIEYEIKYDAIYIKGRNWKEWQLKHKYITEAFKTGNRARKKEAAADTVQGVRDFHYSDDPVLNIQMNKLWEFLNPEDVDHLNGDAVLFYIDVPCNFEFSFKISIYPSDLEHGLYSVHVMFTVEGLETYMYDGDELDSRGLEDMFDRILDAVRHPEKFEEYRAGGYTG